MKIDAERNILANFVSTIPGYYSNAERVAFVLKNIDNLSAAERTTLRDLYNKFLVSMIEKEASDIETGGHGNEGYIWMRTHGIKERANDLPKFSNDETSTIIANLLNDNQRNSLLQDRNLDFSHTFLYERKKIDVRFRSDVYFDLDTLTLNMRAINSAIRPLDTLGFHPNAVKWMSHSYIKFGLSLITGITGSGKSTTLDAIVDAHNDADPAHVIIIASPIEYVHSSRNCIIKHREVGKDVLSFKEGVTQALRQDPDIIIVGEMRDPDTILAALEVTDTGHKVFSTLHTSSAIESIDRIIAEMHPSEQDRVRNRLADVLISVVSQKLIPALDGRLVLAKEVLLVNPNVKAAIKNNNLSEIYMMMNQNNPMGMITMEQDLKRLYLAKKISLENAMAYSNNKTRMQQILTAI